MTATTEVLQGVFGGKMGLLVLVDGGSKTVVFFFFFELLKSFTSSTVPPHPAPMSRGEGQMNLSTRSSRRQHPGAQCGAIWVHQALPRCDEPARGKKSPASLTNRNPDVMETRQTRRALRGNPPATEPDSQSDSSSEEDTGSCSKPQEERDSGAASTEAGRLLRRPRRHPAWSQDYQMFQ